tara:strand:+ start:662 stop:826 length:165 start_codon:yes stop_codon:yes gene_type:complete
MTLDEVQKELDLCKQQLDLVPQIRDRYNFLLGAKEILTAQQKENEKPDLKVAKK